MCYDIGSYMYVFLTRIQQKITLKYTTSSTTKSTVTPTSCTIVTYQ